MVGHLEEIVVAEKYRNIRLGLRMVQLLKQLALDLGCYKVILDCDEDVVGFYEKCSFVTKGIQMGCYAAGQAKKPKNVEDAKSMSTMAE